jgi:hypothetical protein
VTNRDLYLAVIDLVARNADNGRSSIPADQIESPVVDISVLTWEQVAEFLWCGQNYE